MSSYLTGYGPSSPDIMLLTDYPSAEEIAKGKLFTGSNHSIFKDFLSPHKIYVDSCWKTTFFKRLAPPDLQFAVRNFKMHQKILSANQDLIKVNLHDTIEEIREVKPKLIFFTGEFPLRYLTDRKKIGKFRGSPLYLSDWITRNSPELSKIICLPLLPPRILFNDARQKLFTSCDIAKGVKYLRHGFIHPDQRFKISIANTPSELWDFVSRNICSDFGCLDIETHYNLLTCISFCFNDNESISVPLFPLHNKPTFEIKLTWKAVEHILGNKGIPWVNQNIGYDSYFLEKYGFKLSKIVGDNMLLMHTVYPELPKALDFQTSLFTDFEYYKDDVKDASEGHFSPASLKETLYIYNAKDSMVNRLCYKALLQEAAEANVTKFYQERVLPLFFLYRKINKVGLRIDEQKRSALATKYGSMLHENVEVLKNVLEEEPINWDTFTSSPKQNAYVIYDVLDCPKQFHWTEDSSTGTRKKVLSTDEETIEDLILNKVSDTASQEVLRLILLNRKLTKLVSFLDTPYWFDGRMYTNYNLGGTKSGRTSASNSYEFVFKVRKGEFKQTPIGYSFQTIPKHGEELPDGTYIGNDIMEIFIPDDGFVFIEGDKSQAEARVVCVLANDFDTLQYFDKPPGIHKLTASWIYRMNPLEIAKDSKEYDIGKRARHAGNYDMGDYRLSMLAHLPMKEAQLILFKFHQAQPGIRNVFHAEVRKLLDKYSERVLWTPMGRRREFFGNIDEDYFKEGYSYLPQSTISDDLKFGLVRLDASPGSGSWFRIAAEKHDSALSIVHKDKIEDYVSLWNTVMHNEIDFRKGSIYRDISIVVPTELKYSTESWGTMKDLKL